MGLKHNMKKSSLLIGILLLCCLGVSAQRMAREPSLLIGYQRYFPGEPLGFGELGYSLFFEDENIHRLTRRARFSANALLNPNANLYGLQIGGSYSYVVAAGMNLATVRNFPITRSWRLMVNPFVGLDIWFFTFHIGYNLQLELDAPTAPPPPPLGRVNYSLKVYIPLVKNKQMYR